MSTSRLCSGSAGIASQCLADTLSLDTAKSLQLLRLDQNPTSEADLASSALNEGDTVRIHRLVDRGSTRLCACHGNTSLIRNFDSGQFVTCTQFLDNSRLHCKFNQVEREEPDDVLQEIIRNITV